MSTITQLNRRAYVKPWRKVEIKRRLNDGTGSYESNWYDITSLIKQFGQVAWLLDTETIGTFLHNSVTMVGDNTDRKFDDIDDGASIFSGFLTRYKTLVKISTGLIDDDLTQLGGAVFYGMISDDVVLTETEAMITITALTSIFQEMKASALTLAGTDKASDIINKILAITDAGGNTIVDRFLTGDSVTVTTEVYADAVGGSALENQNCWDIISRLCLVEDFCAYINASGQFVFTDKGAGATSAWTFNGSGILDPTYGVNIIEMRQSNDIWTKIKNQIVIEYADDTYSTAGATWTQGDNSSKDMYGERILEISEHWLALTQADNLAAALLASYALPKKEVILTSSTYNPNLELLDKVTVNYYGENSTAPAGLWGVSVFDDVYSEGVGLWTGKKGGIRLEAAEMKIIGITLDLDNFTSEFHLREA